MKYAAFNNRTELAQNKLTAFAYYKLYMIFFSAFLSCLFISCSREEYEMSGNAGGTHTIPMYFNGELSLYDGLSTRAAKTIADGTTLYLKLLSGADTISGISVYHSSYDEWSFTYQGNLSNGNSQCSVYYFENPLSIQGSTAKLDRNSLVYDCLAGSYTFDTKGLTVTANLKPYLNRLRFKGVKGTNINVVGMDTINSFSFYLGQSGGTISSSDKGTTMTVSSNGYTPILYYCSSSVDSLIVTNGDTVYSMPNPLSHTPAGSSISIDIPTEDNYSGWTRTLIRQDRGDISIDDYDYWDDYSPNVHAAVDLGLSVKWATKNLGATSPEDYGDYFAWGETIGYNSGKTTFDLSTYKYCNGSESSFTKYCTSSSYGIVDNKIVLESSDDVATANWGDDWRMPTDAEFAELMTNCICKWTNHNGVNGYKVTSKTNGNSIFLPAAGYRYNSYLGAGSEGSYWLSSLDSREPSYACGMSFDSSFMYRTSYYDRCCGLSVRAVCP